MAIPAQGPRARDDEIAKATQTGQRLAPAARGAGQSGDFGQTSRDQRGERVMPEAQTFDHASGDGDDVFHRAADFDANHVVASVEAKVRATKLGLHERHRARI